MRFLRLLIPLATFGVAQGCVALDGTLDGEGSGRGPTARPGGTEAGRLRGITQAHNAVRRRTEAASPIPDLQWSDELADVAQAYAERLAGQGCGLVHSTSGFGENLAWFGGQDADPTQVVELWAAELDCYTFGTFNRSDACSCDACGHYTQIVWRNTELVGCGVADCPGNAEVWVCNYDPPGNYIGERPY